MVTKKRSRVSNYPKRLAKRGETSASVRMKFYDRQQREHDTIDAAIRANKDRGDDE